MTWEEFGQIKENGSKRVWPGSASRRRELMADTRVDLSPACLGITIPSQAMPFVLYSRIELKIPRNSGLAETAGSHSGEQVPLVWLMSL